MSGKHPLSDKLRRTADDYAGRALYASEWEAPLRLLRQAADALDMSEVDRNCLRAALRADATDGPKQAAAPEAK